MFKTLQLTRLTMLFILAFSAHIVRGQQISDPSQIIKFTPLKLIGISNASVELSYERSTGRNFSTQLMISRLLNRSPWHLEDALHPHINGYRGAIEERLYFSGTSPAGAYIGLEIDFLHSKYKESWNYDLMQQTSDSTFSIVRYEDTLGVKKQNLTINLKFGYQSGGSKLAFDVYLGFGLRHKNVRYEGKTYPEKDIVKQQHPNFFKFSSAEGKYWTISIPLNFKIGYSF